MLKVRLMGTKEEIAWFESLLQRNAEMEVEEISDFYANKGTKKHYRVYLELRKSREEA